jgi:acetyltransferase-like isoleucine patch superfamily enzyme
MATVWVREWARRNGPSGFGKLAAWMASRGTMPYYGRAALANLHPRGFVAASASIAHPGLRMGKNVYIGDGCYIRRSVDGGDVELGDRVLLHGDIRMQTYEGGRVIIGEDTRIHLNCYLMACIADIRIGANTGIASECAFYNFNHGTAAGTHYREQPNETRGPIIIGDNVWIGHGVTVLSGVTIGDGAVVAARALVIDDVPANAIVAGVPARVLRMRE